MKTSGSKRIAERYVRALFDVADEASAVAKVEKDLAALGHALEESEDLQRFLTNPLLSRETQSEAMEAILAKMKATPLTKQFILMLANQKRLPLLPQIAALFIEWTASARGEINGELVSAGELSDKEVKLVETRLTKAYGKKVNLATREDAALLGGVVVKIGSQQLDSSLAGKIARLKIALQAA